MGLRIDLLIIDPQKDFMDDQDASLPVENANADMDRLAKFIDRVGPRLSDIHVTLDSHQEIDVAHPGMWRDQNGDYPAPFTIITPDDIRNGIWVPRKISLRDRMLAYTEALEAQGNYPLNIWPEHCIVGSPGHNVQENLRQALSEWQRKEFANLDYVAKGMNIFTEHYGALQAEVVDPSDPSTGLNTEFLRVLAEADIVVIAGEALSHCLRATVSQIADNIGEEHIKKFHILTDCSSPVGAVPDGPDFPAMAAEWLKDMEGRGMNLVQSDSFMN